MILGLRKKDDFQLRVFFKTKSIMKSYFTLRSPFLESFGFVAGMTVFLTCDQGFFFFRKGTKRSSATLKRRTPDRRLALSVTKEHVFLDKSD